MQKWFDRKFPVSQSVDKMPLLVTRLEYTHKRLIALVEGVDESLLNHRESETWSIKENIGHLIDLEPLWQGRVSDFIDQKEYLREADLSNRKTHEADHNSSTLSELLDQFDKERQKLLGQLSELNEDSYGQTALHPRLGTEMNVVDLCYFVAEHDDHHLGRITEIVGLKD